MFCLEVCLNQCMQCLRRSDPLELELQIAFIYHIGAGNWTRIVWKEQHILHLLSYLSRPRLLYVGALQSQLLVSFEGGIVIYHTLGCQDVACLSCRCTEYTEASELQTSYWITSATAEMSRGDQICCVGYPPEPSSSAEVKHILSM